MQRVVRAKQFEESIYAGRWPSLGSQSPGEKRRAPTKKGGRPWGIRA